MSDMRESTAVGYRLRIEPPGGLSTYPDAIKLLWWGWVVELGLDRKEMELARGMDKDGVVGVLAPATIKHRKSEVGPATPTAPFLTPSHARSRVRSLLTGRAHLNSAGSWWKYDSQSGRSFAVILAYQAEAGHDVFGLSPRGTAWVTAQALKKWKTRKSSGGNERPLANVPGARPVRKAAILKSIAKREAKGQIDFQNMDLWKGDEALINRATKAGTFTGFRRLNARGEHWQPGNGLVPRPRTPRPPGPTTGPATGPGPVDVGKHAPAVQAALAKVAPQLAVQDLAALAGAGATAKVTALPLLKCGVYVKAVHPDYEVRINIVKPGEIHITALDVPELRQNHGIGRSVMDRIITKGQQSGIKRIVMRASREDGDIGYKVWPKSGFNVPIPADLLDLQPASLKDARRISDLYATAKGQAWWAEKGRTIEMSRELVGPTSAARLLATTRGRYDSLAERPNNRAELNLAKSATTLERIVAGLPGVKINARASEAIIADRGLKQAAALPIACDPSTRTIEINARSRFWEEPAKQMKRLFTARYFSTPHADHVLWHDSAHARHHDAIDEVYNQLMGQAWSDPAQQALAARLSHQAASEALEFIAETYTAFKRDVPLDPALRIELERLYIEHGGPPW